MIKRIKDKTSNATQNPKKKIRKARINQDNKDQRKNRPIHKSIQALPSVKTQPKNGYFCKKKKKKPPNPNRTAPPSLTEVNIIKPQRKRGTVLHNRNFTIL